MFLIFGEGAETGMTRLAVDKWEDKGGVSKLISKGWMSKLIK